MSETVHYKGKLTPTNKTTGQYLVDNNVDISRYDYEGGAYDCLEENFGMNTTEIDGKVFLVEYENVDLEQEIMSASKNEDGTIDFEVKFYNGGCGFSEAIEQSVKFGCR